MTGLVVRVAGSPVTASVGVLLTSVLTAEWIDAGGLRHPLPVVATTQPAAPFPEPADIQVELDQHIVIHELPDGRLHTESMIKVVVQQDGERQVVEHRDEQVFTKQDPATDLVIEQDDAVRVRLDDEGAVEVDMAGGMRVSEQPGDPADVFPDGGVVVVQDQDLVVTDVDDGVFDDVEDADVFADFEQSAKARGSPHDEDVDPVSVSQDQARADLFLDSTPPGSAVTDPAGTGPGWFGPADPVHPGSDPARVFDSDAGDLAHETGV